MVLLMMIDMVKAAMVDQSSLLEQEVTRVQELGLMPQMGQLLLDQVEVVYHLMLIVSAMR